MKSLHRFLHDFINSSLHIVSHHLIHYTLLSTIAPTSIFHGLDFWSSFKDPHKVTVLMVVRGGKGSCLGHTRRVPTNCNLRIKPNHPTPNTRVTPYKVDGS